MTETNTENRFRVNVKQRTEVCDGGVAMCWIAGPIRQENAVILRCDILDWVVVGVDSDTCAAPHETADDIFFDTAVDECDFEI